jgi:hypothetical protein
MAAKPRMVETRNNFFMDDSFSKHSIVQARIGSSSPHANRAAIGDRRTHCGLALSGSGA